jgi:hypothetical protein
MAQQVPFGHPDHYYGLRPHPPKETQSQKPLQIPKSQNEGSKDPPQLTVTAPPLPPSYPGPPHGCYPLKQGVAGRER